MSRSIRALALGVPLALSLAAGPALAQTQDNGPMLLVPGTPAQGQPAPTTNPAYGQEFASPQGTPTTMPSVEPQPIQTYSATPAQPMAMEPTAASPQARVVDPLKTPEAADARSAIAGAESTVVRLTTDSGFKTELGNLIDQARAILVIPSFYKAGFIVGASYGNGLLMTRDANGTFSDPAFYRLTAGSVGFQAGLQENEVVMAIMTDRGLKAIMEDQFKGGANASVTFFLIGGGAEAATTLDVGQDIYAFSHSVGLFGGASLEGTAIQPKADWNAAIYGPGATPEAIILNRTLATPLADGLKRALVNR